MGVAKELRRVGKFSAVGTVAFVVDIGLFNLLRLDPVGMGPLWAKALSVTAATTVSWVGSRYWTFRDGRTNTPVKEAIGFFAVNAAGLLIALLCLWFSHHVLGLTSAFADNVSGNVVGVLLGNVFRYLMYRHVLYRPARGTPPTPRRAIVSLDDPAGG
jgi:putative flippase GtrA